MSGLYQAQRDLRATQEREAQALARIREQHPDYDPWLTVEQATARHAALTAQPATMLAAEALAYADQATARAALRDAIEMHHAADEAMQLAADAFSRAEALLKQAGQEVDGFDTLDNEVAEHNAAAIRSGSATLPDLPYHLQAAKRERDKAIDRAAHAQRLHDRLRTELDHAKQRLASASADCHRIALAVMRFEGEGLLTGLAVAEAAAGSLRSALMSLAQIQPAVEGVMPSPVPLGDAVKTALREPPANSKAAAEPTIKSAWLTLHEALLFDPYAAFALPGATPCNNDNSDNHPA